MRLDLLTQAHIHALAQHMGVTPDCIVSDAISYLWASTWDNAYRQLLKDFYAHPHCPPISLHKYLEEHPGVIDGKIPSIEDLGLDRGRD